MSLCTKVDNNELEVVIAAREVATVAVEIKGATKPMMNMSKLMTEIFN